MDAASRAGRLHETLQAAGGGRGVAACRMAGSGPAVCAWGPVSGTSAFEAGSVTKAVTGLLLALAIAAGEVSSSTALAAPESAWDLGAFAPAGGLRATVDDLLRLAWVAARPSAAPFPAAAVDALTPRVAMNGGYVGWCWMLRPHAHQADAWHNGATGTGWAFIGANNSGAIAACVPAAHQPAWDTAALRGLHPPA